jgi:hypothetical protein
MTFGGREVGLRGFALFSAMWASATLFHIGSLVAWGSSLADFALAASAVWLLARPSSVARLALLAILQVYGFAALTPFVSNHTLLAAIVNLTILAAILERLVAERSFAIEGDRLLATFAPPLRLALLALYLVVTLHKLNADYFATDTSCSASLYRAMTQALPFLPYEPGLARAAILGTLATEAALPLLLLFRRTRNVGVLLGALFHGLLVVNPLVPAYNFSSLVYALFALFLPAAFLADLPATLPRSRGAPPRFTVGRLLLLVAVVVAGLGLLWLAGRWPPARFGLPRTSRGFFLLFWLAYAGTSITFYVRWLVRRRALGAGDAGLLRLPRPWLALFPLLVLLNGLAPYLGLKTEQAFAMYSNLRTEGDRTNHYLIPTTWQVFDFQRDLVAIVASTDEELRYHAERRLLLPYFEFHRLASLAPEASVRYVRAGRPIDVRRVADDPALARSPPWLLSKWLIFRGVQSTDRQFCSH